MKHRSRSRHRTFRCGFAAAGVTMATAVLLNVASALAQPVVQPIGSAWRVEPVFEKDAKARAAISGAACARAAPTVCLAGNDEKKYAQFFSINGRTLVPAELIRLVPNKENGFEFDELDIEGVAYEGGFFYLIGSHGAPRRAGKPIDPSRFFAYRFKVSAQTGKPEFKFSGDHVDTAAIEKTNKLREVIRNAPDIGPFAEKPLDDGNGGANIEGIAVKTGRMFLGFRGPSTKGNAFILSVDLHGVFGSGSMDPKVHPLPLGDGIGIRDLARLKAGMLVLSGPVTGTSDRYAISHWNEETNGWKPLAVLGGVASGGKPESLIVLDEEKSDHYRVLVLIESVENGHPLEYHVPR